MSGDMDKIIEISLAKIESSKSRKVTGKSSILHRNLLVNTLLNRVRSSDKTKDPLMNYREPKGLVDMDVDDCDIEKMPSLKDCYSRTSLNQQHTQTRKQSSLVSKLHSRSVAGKTEIPLLTKDLPKHDECTERKENKMEDIPCECLKPSRSTCSKPERRLLSKQGKKRLHSVDPEECCPNKRLRCIWPSNVNTMGTDLTYSITSLASLFGDLVANTEADKASITFGNKFVSAMVAC